MTAQLAVVLVLVAASGAYLAWAAWKAWAGGAKGCGSGCGKCEAKSEPVTLKGRKGLPMA